MKLRCIACNSEAAYVHMLLRCTFVGGDEFVQAETSPTDRFYTETFCDQCFDSLSSEVITRVEDEPPMLTEDAVRDCIFCGSSIEVGESALVSVYACSLTEETEAGQLHLIRYIDPEEGMICLPCAQVFESVLEAESGCCLDDLDLKQEGECPLCTMGRCWRHGICRCNCHG
jgi:hypothetical protein